jgi:hypothetical protein
MVKLLILLMVENTNLQNVGDLHCHDNNTKTREKSPVDSILLTSTLVEVSRQLDALITLPSEKSFLASNGRIFLIAGLYVMANSYKYIYIYILSTRTGPTIFSLQEVTKKYRITTTSAIKI